MVPLTFRCSGSCNHLRKKHHRSVTVHTHLRTVAVLLRPWRHEVASLDGNQGTY